MTQTTLAVILPTLRERETCISQGLAQYRRRHDLTWRIIPINRNACGPKHELAGQPFYPQFSAAVSLDPDHTNTEWSSWLQQKALPQVLIHTSRIGSAKAGVSCVNIDNDALGKLAALHYYESGFGHVAALVRDHKSAREKRHESFFTEARRRGLTTYEYRYPDNNHGLDRDGHDRHLLDWIRGLPKPTGMFLHNDRTADWLRTLCLAHQISIPDQIGLLGVDNITPICESRVPTLSSIMPPLTAMGYEAGRLVHRLLGNGPNEAEAIVMRPVRVKQRDTSLLRYPNPLVNRTIDLLRAHIHQPLTREELCQRLQVSHDRLDRAFRQTVHLPVKTVQINLRLRHACEQLTNTDDSIAKIASQCGYRSTRVFCTAFKKSRGTSPGKYRRLARSY